MATAPRRTSARLSGGSDGEPVKRVIGLGSGMRPGMEVGKKRGGMADEILAVEKKRKSVSWEGLCIVFLGNMLTFAPIGRLNRSKSSVRRPSDCSL